MSQSPSSLKKLPRGTVAVPAASIGVMSLVLALGLQTLGLLDRINAAFLTAAANSGLGLVTPLPQWTGWVVALLVAFALPMIILETPGHGRRTVLWLSALLVVLALGPVSILASHWLPLAAPLIAVIWSGLCATIYASRHHMPCEGGDAGRRKQHIPKT
jgi:hypothetical protein